MPPRPTTAIRLLAGGRRQTTSHDFHQLDPPTRGTAPPDYTDLFAGIPLAGNSFKHSPGNGRNNLPASRTALYDRPVHAEGRLPATRIGPESVQLQSRLFDGQPNASTFFEICPGVLRAPYEDSHWFLIVFKQKTYSQLHAVPGGEGRSAQRLLAGLAWIGNPSRNTCFAIRM